MKRFLCFDMGSVHELMDAVVLRIVILVSVFEALQQYGVACGATAIDAVNLPLSNVAAVGETRVSEELLAKARRDGTVRVIVELQIPAGADDTREQRIRDRQQQLLKELAGTAHAVVRSFTAVPVIVLEAAAAALQVLARSNYVLRVDEDGLAAPLNQRPLASFDQRNCDTKQE